MLRSEHSVRSVTKSHVITAVTAMAVAAPASVEFASRYEGFQHKPLDHTKASIRLISILPKLSKKGLIQLSVQHYDLHARDVTGTYQFEGDKVRKHPTLQYSCLSYTWGDGRKIRPIIINDRPYRVHENLWNFLDFARQRIEKDGGLRIPRLTAGLDQGLIHAPLLWIDAICINQDDTTEKNHQVQQMGEIYASARLVVIWLGGNRDAVPLSNEPEPKIAKLSDHASWIRNDEYWSRAWITQEVALARRPVICVESYMFDLRRSFKELWDPEFHQKGGTATAFELLSAHVRGESFATTQETNLFHALDTFGTTKHCLYTMDRIYSLLALVANSNIVVDYAISPCQLMRHIIRTFRSPLCLCAIFIAANALEITSTSCDTEPGFIVEIELPKNCCVQKDGGVTARCYRCRSVLPEEFQQGNGSYFCLEEICQSMSGHLFAEDLSVDVLSCSETPGHDLTNRVLRTVDCSTFQEVTGISVSPGRITNAFPTRVWRFSLRALTQIASMENTKPSQHNVRLCRKMAFTVDVGGPSAMRKLRACV